MVLIDTSAWLFALRKNYNPSVKERIETLLIESEVAINGIIKLELLGGTKTEKEYERLKTRFDSLYFINASHALWDHACKLAFDLRRKGLTVPYTDIFVAASAMSLSAVLVHADSHYDLIAKNGNLIV